jgi:hypothetical protein
MQGGELKMTKRKIASNRLGRSVAATTGLLMLLGGFNATWADQVLHNLKRPLEVQLQTPVQGATATVGQVFEANLAEPARYQQWTLPAGTHFKGHITKVGHSKHFGRPGYVLLQADEASLPSGQTLAFDPAKYEPRNKVLRHPDAESFPQSVMIQIPYTAASLAVTVPLHYGAGVPVGPCILIGEGVRIVTGSLFGLVRPKFKGEPVPRKLALGALDGSGIPRVVNFIGTYPEPDYRSGDTVKLYLNPQGLGDLFQAGQTAVIPVKSGFASSGRPGAIK